MTKAETRMTIETSQTANGKTAIMCAGAVLLLFGSCRLIAVCLL
jgi:hypothetical protein